MPYPEEGVWERFIRPKPPIPTPEPQPVSEPETAYDGLPDAPLWWHDYFRDNMVTVDWTQKDLDVLWQMAGSPQTAPVRPADWERIIEKVRVGVHHWDIADDAMLQQYYDEIGQMADEADDNERIRRWILRQGLGTRNLSSRHILFGLAIRFIIDHEIGRLEETQKLREVPPPQAPPKVSPPYDIKEPEREEQEEEEEQDPFLFSMRRRWIDIQAGLLLKSFYLDKGKGGV